MQAQSRFIADKCIFITSRKLKPAWAVVPSFRQLYFVNAGIEMGIKIPFWAPMLLLPQEDPKHSPFLAYLVSPPHPAKKKPKLKPNQNKHQKNPQCTWSFRASGYGWDPGVWGVALNVSFIGLKADEILGLAEQLSLHEGSSDFCTVVAMKTKRNSGGRTKSSYNGFVRSLLFSVFC